MKGLYFDSKNPKINDDFQKDWFLFILEDNNNSVFIKNVKTNFYLQFYEDFGFALSQNRSKVELQNTTKEYFNIHSDGEYYMTRAGLRPGRTGHPPWASSRGGIKMEKFLSINNLIRDDKKQKTLFFCLFCSTQLNAYIRNDLYSHVLAI
jgi:hypothetical protein